jgi:peptidoglycan hydrolase CwlO-like protein
MKRTLLLTVLPASFILHSCGPNAAELARMQQHREDSIKAAMQRKYVVAAEMKNTQDVISSLTNQLKNTQARLETESARMSKMTDGQQIARQSLTIQSLKNNIAEIQKNISESEERVQALNVEVRKYQ